MFNALQWNCSNLVETCNIALILFLKCDVTKFRIPPPLSHNVPLRPPPPPPLTCDVIYGWPLWQFESSISNDRNANYFAFSYYSQNYFLCVFTYTWLAEMEVGSRINAIIWDRSLSGVMTIGNIRIVKILASWKLATAWRLFCVYPSNH